MNQWRIIIFLLVASAQIAVPASMILKRENTLRHGQVWKFKTAPVDPVDIFRGRYVSLAFDIGQEGVWHPFTYGERFYLVLKEDTEGFAQIDRVSKDQPEGNNVIEAKAGGSLVAINLPFNQYWVTERDARAADAAYRLESRRDKKNAYVAVRVLNGDAAIEQLYLDGLPLSEYLRIHRAK